jgi:chromate transporter
VSLSRRAGAISLAAFAAILLGLPVLRSVTGSQAVAIAEAFARAGALVFGGGHVVLPLLHDSVVSNGWVDESRFLAGYGAAQAVPGPLFTFAGYLGAVMTPEPNGVLGALIALVAIFLPGALLVWGVLPFWSQWQGWQSLRRARAGIGAAVVGLLAAALYDPIWRSAVQSPRDVGVALAAFLALVALDVPPVIVVVATAAAPQFLL